MAKKGNHQADTVIDNSSGEGFDQGVGWSADTG
jgi:hypothetical protein